MMQPVAVDWDGLKAEWHDRGTDLIRATLLARQLIPDKSLDALRKDLKDENRWLRAFESSGGTSLLAYFVFVWGMSSWELTSNHDNVRQDVAAAREGYLLAYQRTIQLVDASDPSTAAQRDSLRTYLNSEQPLVQLIFNTLAMPVGLNAAPTNGALPADVSGTLLLDAMSVESAVYSGSLVATQARADAIKQLCDKVLDDDLVKADALGAGICSLLREVLETNRKYYGCIAQAADALQRAGDGAPDATSFLDAAIEALAQTREDLGEDVYASELPAYRMALTAWLDRLARSAPRVDLHAVNITYIYPFSLSGITGEHAQEIIMKSLTEQARPTFGGLEPSDPDELQLTDMWTWGGRKRDLNGTVKLPMPLLAVELPDDGRWDYDVELRFNDLGNHYLRVNLALVSPSLNDINQSMRRATTYSGEHDVTSGDTKWASVAQYAKNVITDVDTWLTPYRKSLAVGEYEFNPDFDYHVVVVIHRASVLESDGSRREANREEILREYGPLFAQTLNRETTTLDEWICWGTPQDLPNLLGDACFPTDVAVGTESTTVLYMPSTPNWAQSGFEEVAEFAASFPPLIVEKATSLDEKLGKADRFTQKDDDRDIEHQEAELDRMRADLHKRSFRTSCSSSEPFRSPALQRLC